MQVKSEFQTCLLSDRQLRAQHSSHKPQCLPACQPPAEPPPLPAPPHNHHHTHTLTHTHRHSAPQPTPAWRRISPPPGQVLWRLCVAAGHHRPLHQLRLPLLPSLPGRPRPRGPCARQRELQVSIAGLGAPGELHVWRPSQGLLLGLPERVSSSFVVWMRGHTLVSLPIASLVCSRPPRVLASSCQFARRT